MNIYIYNLFIFDLVFQQDVGNRRDGHYHWWCEMMNELVMEGDG